MPNPRVNETPLELRSNKIDLKRIESMRRFDGVATDSSTGSHIRLQSQQLPGGGDFASRACLLAPSAACDRLFPVGRIWEIRNRTARNSEEMQNLVAAPTGLNCTACLSQKQRNCSSFGSSCTTQWPQADRSALRCPSTDSANSAAPRSTVVVSAFFGLGGSKSSSAKAVRSSACLSVISVSVHSRLFQIALSVDFLLLPML